MIIPSNLNTWVTRGCKLQGNTGTNNVLTNKWASQDWARDIARSWIWKQSYVSFSLSLTFSCGSLSPTQQTTLSSYLQDRDTLSLASFDHNVLQYIFAFLFQVLNQRRQRQRKHLFNFGGIDNWSCRTFGILDLLWW